MNKILVFTNPIRWNQLKNEFDVDKTLWNAQYNTIVEKLVLKYDIVDGKAVLKNLPELSVKEEGIYFVYDQIDEAHLKNILGQCVNDEVFVLVHTSGVKMNSLGHNIIAIQGNHDTEDEHYYYPLFDILTTIEKGDTVSTKVKRVIDSLFLTETSLKFVKEFSVPNNKMDQSTTYRILQQVDRYKKPLEDFRKQYETSKTREEYVDDLIRLQKMLLSV